MRWKSINSNNYMKTSIQLSIILAFTALWEMKFVQMVVIWNFVSELNINGNMYIFIFHLSSSTDTEFQMTTICSNFISQSAVKAWIQGWAWLPFSKYHGMFSTVPILNNEMLNYFRYYPIFMIVLISPHQWLLDQVYES